MSDSRRELVVSTASKLGLLDKSGGLLKLDSLMRVDFIIALEEAANVQIPVTSLRDDVFDSIDAVTAMLADCPAA